MYEAPPVMRVMLVNPFDPLPGEAEQLGRYARLAQALVRAGHRVTWWSSDFSHRFKRRVDERSVREAARRESIELRLLHAPSYFSNVSFRRLRSHRSLAHVFQEELLKVSEPPDVLLASSPPLELACEAVRFADHHRVPSIVDIQDQWPDNFARLFPRGLRWSAPLLLEPLYRLEAEAYTKAAAIIGVAEKYVQRGLEVGGAKGSSANFPLGLDLLEFDEAVRRTPRPIVDRWRKPPGQKWLIYSGSLSHNYDVMTIVRAAQQAANEFGPTLQFYLSGTGDLAGRVQAMVHESEVKNVHVLGFMDFAEWAYLLSQCDAGFNASFPNALIYMPNKVFYYLAAGLAVLNTIPGECSAMLATHQCGLDYEAGEPDSCAAAIRALLSDPAQLQAMRAASRRLAEARFDRATIARDMVRFIEKAAVGADGATSCDDH